MTVLTPSQEKQARDYIHQYQRGILDDNTLVEALVDLGFTQEEAYTMEAMASDPGD